MFSDGESSSRERGKTNVEDKWRKLLARTRSLTRQEERDTRYKWRVLLRLVHREFICIIIMKV